MGRSCGAEVSLASRRSDGGQKDGGHGWGGDDEGSEVLLSHVLFLLQVLSRAGSIPPGKEVCAYSRIVSRARRAMLHD